MRNVLASAGVPSRPTTGSLRATLTVLAVGILLVTGCSDDDDANGTGPATTEAPDDTRTTAETETTTTVEELTNDVIQTTLEEEHPDAAALVDWTIFAWVSGSGYTATIPAGSTADDAVDVCEALSEVVYGHSELDAIAVIAAGGETPLVSRDGPDGGCVAG